MSESRKPLTRRQGEVLDFIREHSRTVGCSPTYREIADYFGWSTTNSANDHVRALEAKGWLTVRRGVARGIVVSTRASCPHCGKMISSPGVV